MKRCLVCATVIALGLPLFAADDKAPIVAPKEGKSETIKLFNGKDLDGWEGHEKYWSVKDGTIVGKNKADEEIKVSTYLVSKKKFSDFLLKSKVKLVGPDQMHSGIAARVWRAVGPAAAPVRVVHDQLADRLRWLSWYAPGIFTAVMDYMEFTDALAADPGQATA